ncbi:MAG: DUF2207 domain-containing protein [Elusimicrobiaceae bacterium]|nr:DUF2207 domain-containing protein [Elusimicrobiaceae bacterium]
MKKIILFLLLLLLSSGLFAQERIVFMKSQAHVRLDGSVDIIEEIVINAEHQKIRRGLYRDIPLKRGEGIEVQGLEMDWKKHPYFKEHIPNGLRINFGNDNLIEKGQHLYRFSYKIKGMIKPFGKYDELYWNATGNDWDFSIDQAVAEVFLPQGVKALEDKISVYTGIYGSKESDVKRGGLWFWRNKPLQPHQGMTLAIPFEKGHVQFSRWQQFISFCYNHSVLLLFLVLMLMGTYGYLVWIYVGKDPAARIVRRFDPPAGVSAAFVQYLSKMEYDINTFSTTLISLIMKGALTARQDSNRDLTLIKNAFSLEQLSAEEQVVYEGLPSQKTITGKYDPEILSLSKSLKKNLKEQTGKEYFSKNQLWVWPLYLISFLYFGWWLFLYQMDPQVFGAMILFAILLCSIGNMFLKMKSLLSKFILIINILVILIFFYTVIGNKELLFVAFLLMAVSVFFTHIMKAYTQKGRAIMNEVEGFKEYLTIGEKGRVKVSDPTDSRKIFCDYLPYAVALEVENKWVESFEQILSEAEMKETLQSRGFVSTVSITSALSCMSSSVSSSCTHPRSSGGSGSGGGGCSGGGSGGGGGGGR